MEYFIPCDNLNRRGWKEGKSEKRWKGKSKRDGRERVKEMEGKELELNLALDI
jgi:hypothetical protein